PAIADRASRRTGIGVLRPEMRLALRATDIALDPGMEATVDDVRAEKGHFPGADRSFPVQENMDVIVEIIWLLAPVVDIAHFLAAHHQLGTLANLDACRERLIGRANGYFELVLPGVPDFQLVVGRVLLVDFPDKGALLRGSQLS